jgi:hypothetical protein
MIDSDTRLEFKKTASAFLYSEKHSVPAMVLTVYETGETKVFNPYITDLEKCIEYFKNEQDAMSYIGTFI